MMARPYSNDLRERLIAEVKAGVSCRSAAARYRVSVSTAIRWAGRWRSLGNAEALAMGGDRRSSLTEEREWLVKRIGEVPDLTLEAVRAELAARGVVTSYGAVWRFYKGEGITFKKKHSAVRAGHSQSGPSSGSLEEISGAN